MTTELLKNPLAEIENQTEFKLILDAVKKSVQTQMESIESYHHAGVQLSAEQVLETILNSKLLHFEIAKFLNESRLFRHINLGIEIEDLQNELFFESEMFSCNYCADSYPVDPNLHFVHSQFFNRMQPLRDAINFDEWGFEIGSDMNLQYHTDHLVNRIRTVFVGWDSSDEFCESCADELVTCWECDTQVHQESHIFQNYWRKPADYDEWFCNSCLENDCYWSEYDECFYRYEENTPEHQSENDDEDSDSGNLENWKPMPIFHGESDTNSFFGIELELEFAESNFNSRETENLLLEISQQWRYGLWYHHRDGSLTNGIELVSHPMSAEFIQNELNLDFVSVLRERGFRSWDAKTCGIHIHIDRRGFDSTVHAYAFANLIYANPNEWQKMAGRNSTRYASFNPNERDLVAFEIKDKSRQRNRYVAVNCTNRNTLEVRIFRGSLNETRIRSAFELVIGAQDYTRQISIRDIHLGKLRWNHFADFLRANETKYPNANHYLNKYYGNGEN